MGGGFGGGGLFAVDDAVDASQFILPSRGNLGAARVSLDELVSAITTTIQPEDWEERGGESTITSLGNALLISAPPETHAQIDNLLKLLRDRWGSLRTISVRAYWLWLDDAQLDSALSAETPEPPMGFGILTDDAWAQLQQTAEGEDVLPGYRAAITFYNGQTVHTMSGGQQLTVRGITPVVGSDTEVGYSPETAVIHTGATLQITGMATRRAEFVVLDLHSRVCTATRLDETNENRVVPTPAAATTDALDRYQISLQRLSTTTRVPVDRTMLVGGMSFDEQPAPGSPSLYLFVRTSVQELRDDREDDK
jgi:hypothetical protein